MAETHENLVLRLLREVRAKQDEDGLRLRHVERTLDEMKDSIVAAMGVAAYASAASERHGGDMDVRREKVAMLERRLADLEARI